LPTDTPTQQPTSTPTEAPATPAGQGSPLQGLRDIGRQMWQAAVDLFS
jgi:hypothetical protein